MTANEYQKNCMKFTSQISTATKDNLLLQGVMGINGEAIDIVKKYLFHGHPLDKDYLAKELGDVLWYIATTAEALDIDLHTIMQMNIEKLSARYGEQFSTDASLHRKKGDI